MKTLLVLRHAKASPEDATVSDHERPLTKRGLRAARRMGELLREHALLPDRVLSSTAERARSTAELAAQGAGCSAAVELLRELYLAEPPSYVEVLRRPGSDAERVLVVGHNPGIEALIYRLTGATEHMPTGALAVCELPIAAWTELGAETRGTLRAVFRPKEVES
jgi:phosphohistidine phosphatase